MRELETGEYMAATMYVEELIALLRGQTVLVEELGNDGMNIRLSDGRVLYLNFFRHMFSNGIDGIRVTGDWDDIIAETRWLAPEGKGT